MTIMVATICVAALMPQARVIRFSAAQCINCCSQPAQYCEAIPWSYMGVAAPPEVDYLHS